MNRNPRQHRIDTEYTHPGWPSPWSGLAQPTRFLEQNVTGQPGQTSTAKLPVQTHTQSSNSQRFNSLSGVAVRRASSRPARGFTLVELLVVISLVAILAGMVLGALYTSQEAARGRRTEALIRKLHDQMAIRWESYQTRRLPIDPSIAIPGATIPTSISSNFIDPMNPDAAELIAAQSLLARRELMQMELPDHYEDFVSFTPVFLKEIDPSTGNYTATPIKPSSARSYSLRLERLVGTRPEYTNTTDVFNEVVKQHQSAECLYLIMTSGLGSDGGAVFSERDTGDTDGDGMPEFIDAWGNPIEWIRWPAGFISDMQPAVVDTSTSPPTVTRDPISNPNPFDSLRIDPLPGTFDYLEPRGYALFPLIVSSGPDGEFGLAFRWNDEADATRGDPYGLNDPEAGATDDSPRLRGETLQFRRDPMDYELSVNNLSGDSGYNGYEQDNVHNHLLNQ